MDKSELPELVQVLLNPHSYPDEPKRVELIQTQMSFVFLTGDYVYKVKKPVNLGYLDYTTLENRLFFCQQEVMLNRRLCPETYLGVIPIARNRGKISLGDEGDIIEYAVKMRQLPSHRMMDVLLHSDEVSDEMISRVAEKLAEFHQRAETNDEISRFGKLDMVLVNTEENFSQTERYVSISISPEQYRDIKSYTDEFTAKNAPLFDARERGGRIKDCHGDLHAAHICFTNGICIYDCIEFNDRFRYCDVASEVAFLAMDLDYHGYPHLARYFVEAYVAISGDRELPELLDFYKCYRAYVRGKVESFKLDDPHITEEDKEVALGAARRYFALAHCCARGSRPLLLITTGLMGTGKTALSQILAEKMGLEVISSDVTRKKLADVPLDEHHFEEFDAGIYSQGFSRRTYEEMLREARQILCQGQSVIMDASFGKREWRKRAMNLSRETNAHFLTIECILSEGLVKQRLDKRLKEGSVSDGRWEIFEAQKEDFEEVTDIPPIQHILVDTSKPADELANNVRKSIERIIEKGTEL